MMVLSLIQATSNESRKPLMLDHSIDIAIWVRSVKYLRHVSFSYFTSNLADVIKLRLYPYGPHDPTAPVLRSIIPGIKATVANTRVACLPMLMLKVIQRYPLGPEVRERVRPSQALSCKIQIAPTANEGSITGGALVLGVLQDRTRAGRIGAVVAPTVNSVTALQVLDQARHDGKAGRSDDAHDFQVRCP